MRSRNVRTLDTPTAFGKNANIGASLGESPTNTKHSRKASHDREHRQQRASSELVRPNQPLTDRADFGGHALRPSSPRSGRPRAARRHVLAARWRDRSPGNAGPTRARRPALRAGWSRQSIAALRDGPHAPRHRRENVELALRRVVAHVERAVFADDGIDQPHARCDRTSRPAARQSITSTPAARASAAYASGELAGVVMVSSMSAALRTARRVAAGIEDSGCIRAWASRPAAISGSRAPATPRAPPALRRWSPPPPSSCGARVSPTDLRPRGRSAPETHRSNLRY